MKSVLVLAGWVALFVLSALPAGAASGVGFPPPPTCHPGVGPCQQTDNFGQYQFIGSPLPGCTSLSGYALIYTKGNGVQHINVNAAQDFWFTFTMVGATTVVQGTVDKNGNFAPDLSKPTFSGHLQQWFGEQYNNINRSISSTANFQGISSTGVSVSLHFNIHLNSTGSTPTIPNMNSAHFDVTCG